MDPDRLREELTCPISLELLEDPVTLSCCGKASSRSALQECLQHNSACPLCRRPCQDITNIPRNRVLQALLDALKAGTSQPFREVEAAAEETPELTALYSVLPVPPNTETNEKIARVTLKVTNAAKVGLRRSLCILVVDRSGSMSGSPWAQASLAMKHVVAMSRQPHVQHHVTLKILTYSSSSQELDCSSSLEAVYGRIGALRAGGGTSFRGAFAGTLKLMNEAAQAEENRPHNVSIVFMTDGQASEGRNGLAEELKSQILQFRHRARDIQQVTVHAMGFSSGCDKVLLQQIREAGTQPGQFRYCEPNDSEDALCGRITGLFESISNRGGCDVTLERLAGPHGGGASWEFLSDDGCLLPADEKGKLTVALRIKPDGVGTAVAWLALRNNAENESTSLVLPVAVTANADVGAVLRKEAGEDGDETTPQASTQNPDWTIAAEKNTSFSAVDSLKRAWVGVRIHVIAEDAIRLLSKATSGKTPAEAIRLEGAFLENRLRAVSTLGSDAHKRVPALLTQLQGLAAWKLPDGLDAVVDLGRLRDLSSASAFSSAAVPVARPKSRIEPLVPAKPSRPKNQRQPEMEETELGIVFPAADQTRNELQNALMHWGQRKLADKEAKRILDLLHSAEERNDAVTHLDAAGNTAVHIAAYHGQFDAIAFLLEHAPPCAVGLPNHDGETPITIAIKRRGFHRTVDALQSFGGSIPADRVEGLIRFCSSRDFTRTAAHLRRCVREGALVSAKEVDLVPVETMEADLPPLVFDLPTSAVAVKSRLQAALRQKRPIDWASLAMVGLHLKQNDLLDQALEKARPEDIQVDWLFSYCFPKKADAPDIPQYLDLLKRTLEFAPDLLRGTMPDTGETLLHRAVTTGSLPHVEFLVASGMLPDSQDASGSSPLHVACFKRYPCIVDSFVESGADINLRNNDGFVPVAIAAQGSRRIVETLIGAGAMVDGPIATDNHGNNLLHTAVLCNQPETLSLLLDRVDPCTMLETNNGGFTPIMAAISKDRKACLDCLLEAAEGFAKCGVPELASRKILNGKTPDDSSILADATPLHVAVHFSNNHALTTLLAKGADPNLPDGQGLAPLHRAAQRANASAVFALVAHGASCTAVDKAGRTPASYGMAHPTVMAALVGPLPGPLENFAAGNMSEEAVLACSDVIRSAREIAAEPGLFSAARVLETHLDEQKQTALLVAASHGNCVASQALVEAGCSVTLEDTRGLSASAWAQMVKSNKLFGALGVSQRPLLAASQRFSDSCAKWGAGDALTVFLGGKRNRSWPDRSRGTTIHRRIALLAQEFVRVAEPTMTKSSCIASSKGNVDRVSISVAGSAAQLSLEADRWASKIGAAGIVASGKSSLRPKFVFATHLSTRHGPLIAAVNSSLRNSMCSERSSLASANLLSFAGALTSALNELPVSDAAQVYAIAPPRFSRALLVKGTEITTKGFASATLDWSVALTALGDCGGESNDILFVISSPRKARLIGSLSAHPGDREVMFPPGCKFRVDGWSKGGRAQIPFSGGEEKEDTEENDELGNGDGSLVVRLSEILDEPAEPSASY